MGKIKQFWHTKKSICIIIAMLLVSLLAIGGLLLLEKEDKPVENKVETGKKEDKKDEGIKVISHLTIGGWLDDRAESKELGPHRSYDGNTSTKWNPQASGNYKGEAGIIYLLNGYYDLEEISLTFGSREYFFDLYVSTDGEEYAQVCSVTSANMSDYFSEGYIFSVGELKAKKVAFVKVVFTGSNSSDNNTYVNFMEISFEGEYQGKGPTQIPDPNGLGIELATISSATLVGEWKEDRSGSKEYNVARSYDNNLYSKWNPQAYGSYKGDPGVVYKLDKSYNLKQIILSFEGSEHYFDLYVSATGSEYTQIASVHQENASMGYSGTVCRLDGLKLEKIRYVKIIFTGRQGNSTWVNLSEIQMSEEGTDNADTSWMLMSKSTDRYEVEIQKAVAIGSWAKDNVNHVNNGLANSYDKNETSKWNPQANSGYKGEPGVVFTLSKAYDIRLMRFTFSGTTHYFDVYVSSNGQTYEQVANITYVNANKGYKDMVCTLDGLKLNDVKYVKVIFTGRDGNSTWVNFMELGLSEKGLGATDVSWMMQGEAMTDYEIKIASAQAIGSWAKDNVNHASDGLTNAYDKNPNTKWNPLANKNYAGDPGVIFALDKEYSIQKMEFTFGSSIHYFNVYVSSDGNTYEKIAAINVLNEKNGYTGTVCTLDGLKASNVKYIKVIFTGRSGNSCWVNFMELGLSQTGSSTADTSWMLPAQVEESNVTIVNATTSGTWLKDNVNHATNPLVNSYDGNVNTKWNPQAQASYDGTPGVIYALDQTYELSTISLTFGSRKYHFDVYVSGDGTTYTKVDSITEANKADRFTSDYVCAINLAENTDADYVKYIKIVFTGADTGSTFVNLMEVSVTGTVETEKPSVPETPDEPEIVNAVISGHEITGTWADDKAASESLGPVKSYDGDATTKWNPQAQTSYAGTPGIIYTLDKTYDLSTINLTFGSRKYHFNVYVSGDGTTYTKVDSITEDNKAERFTSDYVCAINLAENTDADSVKYIKIVFMGADTGSTFVNLIEIGVTGSVVTVKVPEIVNAVISAHQISGTWMVDRANDASLGPVKSYDGDATTKWNPQAQTDYAGTPGIIYTLDRFYYVRNIMLTFTNRQYYFDVYTSADSSEYTLLKSVTASNAAEVYNDFVCNLETTSNDKVKYIKIIFSGSNSADNNAYVNSNEANVKGEVVED